METLDKVESIKFMTFDEVIFDEVIFDEVIFDEVIFDEVIFDAVIFDEVINFNGDFRRRRFNQIYDF
jgi:hypothetical protein